jgi:hypothetical protein
MFYRHIALNGIMILDGELYRMYMGVVVDCFKVLYENFLTKPSVRIGGLLNFAV